VPGFLKENLQLPRSLSLLIPISPSLSSPSLLLPPLLPPLPLLAGVWVITPGKIFGIRDAREF